MACAMAICAYALNAEGSAAVAVEVAMAGLMDLQGGTSFPKLWNLDLKTNCSISYLCIL